MNKMRKSMRSADVVCGLKSKWPYATVVVIVIIVLCVIYRNIDIGMPLSYQGGDEFGVYYIIKTIKETGWYLINPRVGGITGGDMFDYVYSDSLSFLIVRIISFFSENVYVIGNVFYFSNYVFAACVALFVFRKLKFSNEISMVFSILYAFSVYIQSRYAHMWLTPYFLLPLSCYVAIKICEGNIVAENNKFWKDREFYLCSFFSFLCAFTGFYYAFFTCVVYAVAIIIRVIQTGLKKYCKELYEVFFVFSTLFGVFLNAVPHIVYWMVNGTNSSGELATRNIGDAEIYGLKIIQLILPRLGHRIPFLGDLSLKYSANYPLINENSTAALGIVATFGIILSLVWLFKKSDGRKGICSQIIIALLLVGTTGGLGSVFSLLVKTPMRAYNRISIMIMFFCLICVAIVLQNARLKIKKEMFKFALLLMLVVGLYDQTVNYTVSWENRDSFDSTQMFVRNIESELKAESLIFQLPYVNWPSGGSYRHLAGYIESNTLRWSFGCMQGRAEAEWQEATAGSDVDTMLQTLSSNGYEGIYLDKKLYIQHFGEAELENICQQLTERLQTSPIVSNNGELYFWNMRIYNNA